MPTTTNKARFFNPDALSCLANLSSDEVFTPPRIVNDMLDMLPQKLFKNPDTTFLDPACKTGVFLREIAKRLIEGLERTFPDLNQRLEHIYKHQLFGIGMTEITALMSRRSLYCSKYANGDYSVGRFTEPEGNIRYKRIKHTWKGSSCIYCGAPKEKYQRSRELESHAYEFIHRSDPEGILNMKFDVIIGNPPYQLGSNDKRSTSRDKPIYNQFIEQAKKLKPRYLTMIIPSRWMASGLGLNDFRRIMLKDLHIRKLVDFPVANEVFPGVEVKGGICYFLWDRDNTGFCEVTTVRNNNSYGPVVRNLGEFDVFVRDSRALDILHKVIEQKEPSMIDILSVDKEFGWTSNYDGFHDKKDNGDVALYYNRKGKRLKGWINRNQIMKSTNLIDKWKVMIPQAGSDGGQKIPDFVLGTSFIVPSPSVCTQTYLFFYTDSENEAKSINSYVQTKFFRFLVSLRKITQHATRSTYTWVPQQDWNCNWTDNILYEKYGLSEENIAYIETMIRPMDQESGEDVKE